MLQCELVYVGSDLEEMKKARKEWENQFVEEICAFASRPVTMEEEHPNPEMARNHASEFSKQFEDLLVEQSNELSLKRKIYNCVELLTNGLRNVSEKKVNLHLELNVMRALDQLYCIGAIFLAVQLSEKIIPKDDVSKKELEELERKIAIINGWRTLRHNSGAARLAAEIEHAEEYFKRMQDDATEEEISELAAILRRVTELDQAAAEFVERPYARISELMHLVNLIQEQYEAYEKISDGIHIRKENERSATRRCVHSIVMKSSWADMALKAANEVCQKWRIPSNSSLWPFVYERIAKHTHTFSELRISIAEVIPYLHCQMGLSMLGASLVAKPPDLPISGWLGSISDLCRVWSGETRGIDTGICGSLYLRLPAYYPPEHELWPDTSPVIVLGHVDFTFWESGGYDIKVSYDSGYTAEAKFHACPRYVKSQAALMVMPSLNRKTAKKQRNEACMSSLQSTFQDLMIEAGKKRERMEEN